MFEIEFFQTNDILKIKCENVGNWKAFFKNRNFKNLPKWRSTEKLTPDKNLISIITSCSYSPEMRLRYMKNILHVAHFDTNMVLLTRNMFKEVKVPKSRGALGTGFTYVPILWQSCGKPSTKCLHGGRVECLFIPGTSYFPILKIRKNHIFLEIIVFSKFQKFRDIMDPTLA